MAQSKADLIRKTKNDLAKKEKELGRELTDEEQFRITLPEVLLLILEVLADIRDNLEDMQNG